MNSLNRHQLLNRFNDHKNALIYLAGGKVNHWYDTDTEIDFRQESNFLYLSGIEDPDFALFLDISHGKFILVTPKRDASYATWYGKVYSQEYYKEEYDADQVIHDVEVEEFLNKRSPEVIYCYNEQQRDTLPKLGFSTNVHTLRDALVDCRIIKNEFELDIMRSANLVASEAHKAVMSELVPGMNEAEARALFLYHTQMAGQRHEAYIGIHAGGRNGAILHYIKNDEAFEDGDFYLLDAGAQIKGYAADITRTYPVNGRFSDKQKNLYTIALSALDVSIEKAIAGVKMEDLHLGACKIILDGLKSLGLVKGSLDDLMENNVFALFFPHGLGHFLGLDTHDVGGYPKGVERIDRPGIQYLRVRRKLEPGMVITIEPGIYFIDALLEPAFENEKLKPFLNEKEIRAHRSIGGIRVEDNIIIGKNSNENMTTVPKSVEDIERFMA